MAVVGLWSGAIAVYALLLAWYFNWRRPLEPHEVTEFVARIGAANPHNDDRNDLETIRRFLSEDDGRQFFMVNLVKLSPEPVADPATGEMRPARQMLERYTRPFMRALVRRAGHPAIVARKVGAYVDAWGVEPDPGWTILGYVRYRSRRDLAELVSDPRFAAAHDYKFAAMPQTFSFPTQPVLLALVSPAVTVGLGFGLVTALVHLAVLT